MNLNKLTNRQLLKEYLRLCKRPRSIKHTRGWLIDGDWPFCLQERYGDEPWFYPSLRSRETIIKNIQFHSDELASLKKEKTNQRQLVSNSRVLKRMGIPNSRQNDVILLNAAESTKLILILSSKS